MTDEQVADIYAIARDSFNKRTARKSNTSLIHFRDSREVLNQDWLDPNIDWKKPRAALVLEVTGLSRPSWSAASTMSSGATTKDEISASEPCPALKRSGSVEALVAGKGGEGRRQGRRTGASGVKPIHLVYADGGQNRISSATRIRAIRMHGERTWDRPQRPGETESSRRS